MLILTLLMATAGGADAAPAPTMDAAAPVAEDSEIVVEAQRLSESELADTTLVMERGRHNRVSIEIRANGSFRSFLNGLDSDFGTWRVSGEMVCFDGRARGSFCAPGLAGKDVGDRWIARGQDGRDYDARLVAGT